MVSRISCHQDCNWRDLRMLIEGQVRPKNILIISASSAMAEYSGVGALRYIGTIART